MLTRNAVHTNPIVCQHGTDVQQILAAKTIRSMLTNDYARHLVHQAIQQVKRQDRKILRDIEGYYFAWVHERPMGVCTSSEGSLGSKVEKGGPSRGSIILHSCVLR